MFSDITLIIGPAKHQIYGQKAIICERSGYFRRKLVGRNDINEIVLPDFHYQTFHAIIGYLYSGTINHSAHPGLVARLYVESVMLEICHLEKYTMQYLDRVFGGICQSLTDSTWNKITLPDDAVPGPVPVNYIVAVLQGVSLITYSNLWAKFGSILEHAVRRPEFREWMKEQSFLDLLDGDPVLGRMLLQKYHDYHELKMQESITEKARVGKIKAEVKRQGDLEGGSPSLFGRSMR